MERSKTTLQDYPFLIKIIEQWPVRMNRARITQNQVAKEAGLNEATISLLINKRALNPRLSTIQKVETVLSTHGV